MPYIARELRAELEPLLGRLCEEVAEKDHPGVLNYAITRLVLATLGDSPRYADYNAAIGVLECAKLELFRDRVAPYEDHAKVTNGPLR